MKYDFPVTRTTAPKPKPPMDDLGFARHLTDHMFEMHYNEGKGWHSGRILPYGPISIDPGSSILHYAQMMFEGMKAYKRPDGKVQIFRPEMNVRRLNRTNERMCMPQMEEELFIETVRAAVRADIDWVPDAPHSSLYIRPFIFADEVSFSVLPAEHYRYMIILAPSGPYYATKDGGLATTRIYVESEFIRAAQGGTGYAKVGGNYAGGMLASKKAMAYKCKDVLWLDAAEHKYVEEIGTSNAFFVINGEVVTSPLTGTILPGVTRDSVLHLLRHWGVPVAERRLSVDELFAAAKDGSLQEVFASGTAAVISPIGCLHYLGTDYTIADGEVGRLTQRIYDTLYGIQRGMLPDAFGWTVEV